MASKEVQPFNYQTTKRTFEELQGDYIKQKRKALVKGTLLLWSRERVDAYIATIQKGLPETELPLETIADYDVVLINGVYKLKLKNRKYQGEHVVVIPMEDCFDVILDIHRRLGHRGPRMNMMKHVFKRFVVDKIWIVIFLKSCNFCQCHANFNFTKSLHSPTPKNHQSLGKVYQLSTYDIESPDDKDFQKILIVIERKTNFVHLRPLTDSDGEMGLAVEVFKIFTDFGIPKLIETTRVKTCDTVSSIIRRFMPKMHVPVSYIYGSWTKSPALIVQAHLDEWMQVTGSSNWSSGLQYVQWQINNTPNRNRTTPYEQMFHIKPVKEPLYS